MIHFQIDFLEMLDVICLEQIPGRCQAKPSDFPIDQVIKGLEIEFIETKDMLKCLELTVNRLSERKDYYLMSGEVGKN